MTQREQSFPIFSSSGDGCIHVVRFISLSFYGVSVVSRLEKGSLFRGYNFSSTFVVSLKKKGL